MDSLRWRPWMWWSYSNYIAADIPQNLSRKCLQSSMQLVTTMWMFAAVSTQYSEGMNFHHVSKIRQTFAQMNNVFNTTSKIEMSSPITYHGFHLQHEVHNNHLFIVIWAQPERMCSRNCSLNLFICHEFIQMGGLTTLQGSTQTYTNNLRDGKSTNSRSTKCWIYVMVHSFTRHAARTHLFHKSQPQSLHLSRVQNETEKNIVQRTRCSDFITSP